MVKAKKKAAKKATKKAGKAVTIGKNHELLDRARKAIDGDSYWRPENKGDAITGTVLSARTEMGQYGEQWILLLQTSEGVVKVFCNTVLGGLVERNSVTDGDKVAIVFQGMKQGKRGRPFKMFSLAVDKASEQKDLAF